MSKIDKEAPEVSKKSQGSYDVALKGESTKPSAGDPNYDSYPPTKSGSGGPKNVKPGENS